jgi:hypothetical protein
LEPFCLCRAMGIFTVDICDCLKIVKRLEDLKTIMKFVCVCVCYWSLNSVLAKCSTIWATLSALFCVGYFQDRVSWTVCSGWLTMILLISSSWTALIKGHWHPVTIIKLICDYFFWLLGTTNSNTFNSK